MADSVAGFYEQHGLRWDAARSRVLFERADLEQVVSAHPAPARVLDLGCGGGEPMSAYFIAHGHPVVGVDNSRPLVELCRRRFPTQRWIEADMRRLALTERFEIILAWDSLFHLTQDDQRAMFDVIGRHAARHAAVLFTTGPAQGVEFGSMFGERLHHASLGATEYRRLLGGIGFEVVEHRRGIHDAKITRSGTRLESRPQTLTDEFQLPIRLIAPR